ncbi:TMV resistance protein N [Quercus suber]|uniref:TMV resistance protein N n=1 Tax=Quercus suber TaxID=58331 RepID=UPI0032DE31B6
MASMKCKSESSPSPSSSSTRHWKYEVFLSFKGEDTRYNFADHLYAALKQKGIITFRDEEELKRGKSISKLFEAIEESHIAIIIFSKNYACSKWCLKELAKINECRKEIGLIVLPIFYNVEPADVKKQTGTFEQAFIDHQKCFEVNIKEVETWRIALKEVANISGWHLQNRPESEFIQDVVKEMMEKLSSKSSSITKNFIGIESTLAKFIPSYLNFENNICMIGIYGMGGLGKTTLARVVYDKFCGQFEGSSFITNVREDSKKHGLPKLQQQLLADILEDKNIVIRNVYDGVDIIEKRLCRKKVLLVIDDVDHLDQLEKLAGGHDWFGLGSKIIITTRDERVLIQHRVRKRYNPNGLNNDDALKLFCLKAFKNEQPKKGYMQLSQEVVKYANGLPLALVTLGSFLVGRTIDEWQSALPSFKKTKGDIFNILKISYDGLEEMWKEIFLDIACFFRYWKKNQVMHILENCGFNARIGISILVEKSLLSVDGNEHLEMHDLVQEMGEKIVCFESKGKLGKQSRLWLNNDLLHVLKDNMATNAIEAIVVGYKKKDFKFEEFLEVLSKMSNLRLMIIDKVNLGFPNDQRHLDFPNQARHVNVPNQLRHLSWNFYPLKCLSFSSQPMELVHLELRHSYLEYLWQGVMVI